MRKRMLSQDIAKGLAILVVVQLHSLQPSEMLYYVLAVLLGFAMPFFIFMSGYNYRSKGLTPVQNMKKRVLMILKVFACWTIGIFLVMGAYFLIRGDGTPAEILRSFAGFLLSESGCKMIGWELPTALFQHVLAPLWYLQYLVTASVLFYLTMDCALRSLKHAFSLVFLGLAVTFVLVAFNVYLPWGLHCAPVLAAIMITGAVLGQENRFFTAATTTAWKVVNTLICLAVTTAIQYSWPSAGLLGAGNLGEVAGSVEVLFLFCFGVFGSWFLIHIGMLLEKVPVLSKGLIWLGQHTLIILCLHRPVAYVIRDLMGLPHFIAGSYTDVMTGENIIAFLLVFVVMIPVILLVDRIKKKRSVRQSAS